MPPSDVRKAGHAYDLKDLISLIRRRLKLVLAVTAGVFFITVLAVVLVTPVFSAEAGIRLDPNQRGALDAASTTQAGQQDTALIDTELAVMQSYAVASNVVRNLNLVADEEFNPRPGLLRAALGAPQASDPARTFERVTKRFRNSVSIKRDGVSYMVSIEARSKDPAKAARLANAIAEQYLSESRRQKIAAALSQQKTLGGSADTLQSQAEAASAAVARYRAETGIVSGGGVTGTVVDQRAAALASELSSANSKAAEATAKVQAARVQLARGNLDSVPEVLASAVIGDLRRQRADIIREKGQIDNRVLGLHPEKIRIESQLKLVDGQIQNEVTRIIQGLESEAAAATSAARAIQGELSQLEGRQRANAKASVEAEALQRKADSLTGLANSTAQVVQRAAEQAQVGETPGQVAIVAVAPISPSFPNKPLFAVLGVIVGAILGLAAAVTLEMFDSSVRTAEDVEGRLGLPCLSSIPVVPKAYGGEGKRVWDYVPAKPHSSFAEALRAVRSTLKLSPEGSQVITVTSALPNEGKTSTAISLARVMAMSGDRIMLIDGDLRRNAMRGLIPKPRESGLVEFLTGKATLDQVVVKDSVERLHVLPLTGQTYMAADLFGGGRMAEAIETLRPHYDHIIIDTPPVLAVADARQLASLSDAVLLIVRWSKTPEEAVRAALDQLENDATAVLGAVLTQVDLAARGQLTKGDSGYYAKMYRDYYVD